MQIFLHSQSSCTSEGIFYYKVRTINPYRYAGYRYDEETKMYYVMARYYNPNTGMFLSLDPVRGDTMNPITMNGYNYANNNPVMNVDPNSNFSVRTSVLIGVINVLVVLILGLAQINNFIKLGSKFKTKKLSNGKKITSGN